MTSCAMLSPTFTSKSTSEWLNSITKTGFLSKSTTPPPTSMERCQDKLDLAATHMKQKQHL